MAARPSLLCCLRPAAKRVALLAPSAAADRRDSSRPDTEARHLTISVKGITLRLGEMEPGAGLGLYLRSEAIERLPAPAGRLPLAGGYLQQSSREHLRAEGCRRQSMMQ